jgi:hypothetical protein
MQHRSRRNSASVGRKARLTRSSRRPPSLAARLGLPCYVAHASRSAPDRLEIWLYKAICHTQQKTLPCV